MKNKIIDSNSEEGITIGIIDSIITQFKILNSRNLKSKNINNALKNLKENDDFLNIIDKDFKIQDRNIISNIIEDYKKSRKKIHI